MQNINIDMTTSDTSSATGGVARAVASAGGADSGRPAGPGGPQRGGKPGMTRAQTAPTDHFRPFRSVLDIPPSGRRPNDMQALTKNYVYRLKAHQDPKKEKIWTLSF